MATYDRTTTIAAPVDDVFEYVSDVAHLPDYLEEMVSARPADGEAVDVTAVVDIPGQGRTEVESRAWFRTLRSRYRIEWGSEGDNDYHGSIDVSAEGDGSSVVLSVHTLGHEPDDEDVYRSIDAALSNIADAVTGTRR